MLVEWQRNGEGNVYEMERDSIIGSQLGYLKQAKPGPD